MHPRSFPLFPAVIGDSTHQKVTSILNYLPEDPIILIVPSSDLCHFLDYQNTIRHNQGTSQRVLEGSSDFSRQGTCGHVLLNSLGAIRPLSELNPHQLFKALYTIRRPDQFLSFCRLESVTGQIESLRVVAGLEACHMTGRKFRNVSVTGQMEKFRAKKICTRIFLMEHP